MRVVFFFFLTLLSMSLLALDWKEVERRCRPVSAEELPLYREDFIKKASSLDAIEENFNKIYQSGKRLKSRAYFDSSSKKFIVPFLGDNIVLPRSFITVVQSHIESILEMGYANFVFYSDMGHSHFFFELDHYKKSLRKLKGNDFYAAAFSHPETKILYHVSEKLVLKENGLFLTDDPYLRWLYYVRNPMGYNNTHGKIRVLFEPTKDYNTAQNLEGHWYHFGFNLNSSKEGCFPYKKGNQQLYFDFSLSDPGYNPKSFPQDGP